jgi:hypothetical protein
MELCGEHLQAVWKVRLNPVEAPAVQRRLAAGGVRLGELLRDPDDREKRLHAVPLLLARGGDPADADIAPDDDALLAPNDELLLVGWPAARRLLDSTLVSEPVGEYVLEGRHVPSSWVWRTLTRHRR